eukprot:179884_1
MPRHYPRPLEPLNGLNVSSQYRQRLMYAIFKLCACYPNNPMPDPSLRIPVPCADQSYTILSFACIVAMVIFKRATPRAIATFAFTISIYQCTCVLIMTDQCIARFRPIFIH